MNNRQTAIGSIFLHRSLCEIADLQVGRQERVSPGDTPPTFKIFHHTAFYPLSQTMPLALGDARWSFPTFRQEHQTSPRLETLDIQQLSTFLYYTYGFSRYDTGSGVAWP